MIKKTVFDAKITFISLSRRIGTQNYSHFVCRAKCRHHPEIPHSPHFGERAVQV